MASGMEMMVNALVKSLGIDPIDIKNRADEFRQIMISFEARFKALEQNIEFIKERLMTDDERKQFEQQRNAIGAGHERIVRTGE